MQQISSTQLLTGSTQRSMHDELNELLVTGGIPKTNVVRLGRLISAHIIWCGTVLRIHVTSNNPHIAPIKLIGGCEVTVIAQQLGIEQTQCFNELGVATFYGVTPGNYEVRLNYQHLLLPSPAERMHVAFRKSRGEITKMLSEATAQLLERTQVVTRFYKALAIGLAGNSFTVQKFVNLLVGKLEATGLLAHLGNKVLTCCEAWIDTLFPRGADAEYEVALRTLERKLAYI